MKAVRVHTPGGPEVLKYEDVPDPVPQQGEILVAVEATGLNFIDVYYRKGLYKGELPLILGQEGAGTVKAVGPGAKRFKVGDRVAWAGVLGSYAELQAIPEDKAVSVPDGVTTRQAAAVMLQGMTAHFLTTTTFPLKPGNTCLLHAAAGGVGLLASQMAKLRGARVIGTVSTPEKEQLARKAGCDEVIRYTEQDFVSETRRLTNGEGVEVVYDSVGKTTFLRGFEVLKRRGMMVLFGQSSGPVDPIDPQLLNKYGSLFLTRPTLHHYIATRPELEFHAGEVLGWVKDHKLEVRIHAELPLAQAAEAHRMLEGRKTTGKVVLIP